MHEGLAPQGLFCFPDLPESAWRVVGYEAPQESQTRPRLAGRGWFPYFHLYGPKKAYFDRFWQLNDIEPMK
jgi:hypothetical protein